MPDFFRKRLTGSGPPAKLGHWDEKAKSIKPDPLPGKGDKLPLDGELGKEWLGKGRVEKTFVE